MNIATCQGCRAQVIRETKLMFREPAIAAQLAETLLSSKAVYGYPCRSAGPEARYTDLYFDDANSSLTETGRSLRLRRYSNGTAVWQIKTRQVARGNEWVYHVETHEAAADQPPVVCADAPDVKPVLRVVVERREVCVDAGKGIVIGVDTCTFQSPGGRTLGRHLEVEAKAPTDCSAFDPLVEHLRTAYGLIPATRSKAARGLALLRGSAGDPRKAILDMDPGVDDAIAILLALASPELDVLAITTVAGNVDLNRTTRNARLVVDAAKRLYRTGKEPLISKGLTPRGDIPDASDVHGIDGLGGYSKGRKPSIPLTKRGGPDIIADLLEASPGEIIVVSTGPLTNLAECVRRHPASLTKAKALVAMGGVFFQEGNRTAAAEFNVHRDPESAQAVVQFARDPAGDGSCPPLPMTFVGLDVTHRVRFYRTDLKGRRNAKAAFLRAVSSTYMDFYHRNEGLDGFYLHDPLAVAYAIDPSLCDVEPFHVEVETAGIFTAGETIADSRPTRQFGEPTKRATNVCVTVDAERARKLILERVLG